MLESCHTPDVIVAAVIVATAIGWLATGLLLRRRANVAHERVADLTLELIGANHRLQQAREQADLLAHHDPLTGLLVQSELQRGFQTALALAKRTQTIFAIILIGLADDQDIAAKHGTEVLNRILAAVALRLRNVTREMDMVASLGGNQFGALLPHIGAVSDIDIVTRKLRDELERPYTMTGLPAIHVQTIMGYSCFPRDGSDWPSMLKAADDRLARGRILIKA